LISLGKDKLAILPVILLFLSVSSSGQTGKVMNFQLKSKFPETTIFSEDQSIIINYSISELNIENLINDNGSFYRISIPGHAHSTIPGKPELPVFSKLITIPEGADCKVTIKEVISSKISPSSKKIQGLLVPTQDGITKNTDQDRPRFRMDKAVYATRGIISSDTVTIKPLGIVRNKNLANVFISPIRYNPKANLIEVISSMKIIITFEYPDSYISKSNIPESKLFSETLNKGILNFNPANVVPGYSEQPVEMLILTDTAFKKQLEPFLEWKTQKGFKLKILYKGTGFAGNTYSEIRETITKLYKSSSQLNPAPEYLLIIGDVTRIPYTVSESSGIITDMYYGEFDGNRDYIPEMYVGRLPVADTTELNTVLKKIVQYEKFEFADTNKFYTKALVTAGYDNSNASIMNGQLKYAVTNYLTPVNKINEQHFYYFSKLNLTGALAARKDSLIKSINKGTSYINYTGHGASSGWLHLNIDTSTVRQLTNKNMYPFVISNACQTAQFNLANSFGNRMVVSSDKGAIGFIGCSKDSYWDEDFYWAVGAGPISANPTYQQTGLGAYDRMFHTHKESPSDWYYTMGQVVYAGNLAVSASTSIQKQYYWETYNLIGDPSVIPVIGTPDTFNVSIPDTLPNGIKSYSLNLEPFAYAAVSHFDTLWDASFSSISGSVVLNMPGLSDDSCLIVVTGQNKIPFIKKVYFSDVKKEYINLESSGINDSEGNNNSKADFGESFFLKLQISNLGSTEAQNLYAKISSTSPWVTINKDSAFIGTITANSEKIVLKDLGITVSENIPDLEIVTVRLLIKGSLTEKQYVIDLIVHAPDLEVISCLIDDTASGNGDYIPDPGESFNLIFKVRNKGSSEISGDFSITRADEGITVLDSQVKSGVLKFGQITDIPVAVKLSDIISSGSFISLSSQLSCSPFLIIKNFSFRVGKVRESFEALSFDIFPWINVSSKPWVTTGTNAYEGTISAKSGAILNNESTTLTIKTFYSTADTLKFSYKVSSELNYDYFSFRLNGVEILKKSGEIQWTKTAVKVPAGLNKMEWIYKKDDSKNVGSDCAWIDMIDFTGTGTVNYIKKDIQVVKIESPIQKEKYGQETITVKVRNLGKETINGFNLAYVVNSGLSPVKQFFENKIQYNDSVTVSFTSKVDMSRYGIYNMTIYGTENKDDYIVNDTAKVNIENIRINEVLSVFPNPFIDQLSIFINSQSADKLEISLTSLTGVKLFDTEKDILSGKNKVIITIPNLAPELYYLRIKGTVINKTVSVVKIKN
jgi:hypothetical protein